MMLANPRHEMFAAALFRGASYEDAGKQANLGGMNVSSLKQLAQEPKIQKRVTELRNEADKVLGDTLDDLETMTAAQVRALVDENWIIRELVMSIKMSQVASQFNATKALIEMLGKEIGMFGGNGTAGKEDDPNKSVEKVNIVMNVLQNIGKIQDMSDEMVNVTPDRTSKVKTQKIEFNNDE